MAAATNKQFDNQQLKPVLSGSARNQSYKKLGGIELAKTGETALLPSNIVSDRQLSMNSRNVAFTKIE